MGHHDGGLPGPLHRLAEHLQHLAGGAGVQGAGWLVEETTSGCVTRALASATRCCCPPDSWLGRCSSRTPSSTTLATSRTSSRSTARPASRSGSEIFSSTVSQPSRL
jgi:hypothetical protein